MAGKGKWKVWGAGCAEADPLAQTCGERPCRAPMQTSTKSYLCCPSQRVWHPWWYLLGHDLLLSALCNPWRCQPWGGMVSFIPVIDNTTVQRSAPCPQRNETRKNTPKPESVATSK